MQLKSLFVDAAKTETYFTLMTKRMAFIISLIFAILTVLLGIISFLIPNTKVQTSFIKPYSTQYAQQLDIREEYIDISNFNNFIHFDLIPNFANPKKERNIDLRISCGFYVISEDQQIISSPSLSKTISYAVSDPPQPIRLYDFNSTYFTHLVALVSVSTSLSDLANCTLQMTTLQDSVAVSSLTFSSICCIFVMLMLLFVNIRRVRPSAIDQWFTLILTACLLLINGPWQVCQYFAIPGFSVVYDLMPQVFHVLFLMFVFSFFQCRTKAYKSFFSNIIIKIATFVFAIVIIALEFAMTSGRQLTIIPVIEKSNKLFIALIIFFFLYHIWVIGTMILGFKDVQIDVFWSYLLAILLFFSLEIINVAVFLTRMFISQSKVGFSAAIDLFYILEANLVCFLLNYLNTPISMSGDQGSESFLVPEDVDANPL